MYYRVERTYLTDSAGRAASSPDRHPHMIVAESSREAALVFIAYESGHLIGEIAELAGDKAAATAVSGSRMFVIFVERGAESVAEKRREQPESR
jgi:hypothetical protein